ncbi:MAG: ComF family protein [Dehalobacterium sp.]|jgi:competence protein ComFC
MNLIFPHCRCISCGAEAKLNNTGLCDNCRGIISEENSLYHSCALCPTFIPLKERYCDHCFREHAPYFDAALAVFPYHGAIRQVLHDFKYRGAVKWDKPLGALMEEKVNQKLPFHNISLIIPVPLHPNRQKIRGYNQSELLAREIGRRMKIAVDLNTLQRVRDTPSQTGLSREERRKNLHEAFQVVASGNLIGKTVLLVDDIYTTGTTVKACARILKKGGAKKVFVVTCAAGKRF